MPAASYQERRGQLQTYFDRTAVEAWARLTSTAPVGRIRATVRAGRDQMRHTLLGMLPAQLSGRRILDAGCGTGALSVEAAQRGAQLVAVDISPTLVDIARDRLPSRLAGGSIDFRVGDMFDAALGEFDHVVAMDSLIHYRAVDVVRVLAGFAVRTRHSIVFTFAPKTPALTVMHAVGRWFPRHDRAPAIEPVSESTLRRHLAQDPVLRQWRIARTQRIACGFYTSQAMELVNSREDSPA
ncbi:MAG: magnesium protoporphyrin IX methyltransferase [Steroidobacteraceae bacterium]|jgi:magnesium-protoporphyrin O-methyltransferase